NITGTSNSTSFDVYNLTDGEYAWNCLAYNSLGGYNWSTYNYTIKVNTSSSSVSWNQSILNLGTGDPASGPLEGSAAITSTWSNENVAVTCDSGDCATITETWIDTTDMANEESLPANFTCSNSTEGTFSAIFNLTSDNDTEPAQLTVNCKIDSTMVVELLTPADDSVDADGSITFTCNATDLTGMQNITLWGNWSDASVGMNEYATWVYNDSYWRYNDSDVWPGADWNGSSFDDSQWPFAQGPFGNDSTANLNAHVNTILTFGDTGLAYVSYYFRTTFNITNTSAITEMNFTTDYDDGYVVFINGYEINRSDNLLGVDETSHSATTTEYHHWSCDDDDCAIKASKVPMYPNITLSSEQMGYLVNGTNHIAVLLKQRSGDGTDALIALRLYGYQNTTWGPIETNPLSGTENSTAFIVNGLENGTYEWNCLAYDSNGNPGWAPANYSFEVNTSSIAVHWNQTSLGLGSAYIGSGPLNGSANVASTGSNTNVTAECVFGNCAQITEDWVDGINMSDAQSFKANFTCASAVGGNFSALFNLTSNEDSAPQPLNVSCEIIEIPYAPVTENVTLNTSLGTNTTDENLTLHYDSYDLNGDAIKNITNWHLDGQPFALLYLPFEANSSSSSYTKDYSNRSNDGTVYNATWSATGGYDGFGAYDFTRTPSSSISIGKKLINNSPSFSAFAWVYPESDFYGGIITQDLGSSIREWFLAHNTNHTLRIRIYNESFSIFQNDSAGNTVPLNTWTHVGIVVDDDAKMAYGYINGEVATSIAFTGPLRTSTEAVTKIGWTYSDDYDFEGLIDEVLIYNRSLSPEQVEALYNNRTDLIVSNETDLGDIWYACVTPNDGNGDGSQACSNTVTIAPLNPPQIISYNINYTNYWVRSNEELFLNITNCTGGALAYNWTVDGAIASSSSSFSMDGSAYSLGVHNVTAKCYDPLGRSDNVSFSIEVIHKDDFTLLVIPDTEAYAESYPNIFTNQTYWATELKDELNMVFATHLGDVVADGSSNASEWINANDSMSLLDNLLPYALSIGEHDYDDEGTTRAATYWANYFPITRYNGESWWGGQNNSNENYNTYQYFNASGIQFMVLHLEFCPRDETIAWANQTIINNPDKIVIISTHLYLNDDNTTIDSGDSRNCDTYGVGGNNGDGQWDKLVKYHPNVYLVVSGHVLDTGVGYLNSTGTNGNEIHQVLSNYEMKSEGGAGYLRIMRFSPIENKVIIQSYSPYEDSFYTDISNEFNISGFLNAPYVALDTPAAGYSNDTLLPVNLAFNATVSSTNGLANCSLWHSISGWSLNQTINVTGTLNSTEFNLTGLSNTSFTWNIQCFDNEGNSGWGSPNRTVALGNATAPVTVNVTLNTSLGLNGPNENLTLYYYSYDLSDDAIKNITNWYLNGTPIMLLNMPFEGGSNSTYAKDYSNLSNYGTVYNATWGAASGYDGFGAYEFTPSPASSISIGKKLIDTPRSFSAFAWAYPYSYSYGAIVSQDEGGNDREWFLARFGTSLRIRVYNTSIGGSFENDSAADTFPQDKWSYVGIVVNDSAKMVYGYINGQLATSVAYTGTLRTTTTALTKIGWMYSDAYVFDGRIDDVQIYNRSLSAAQVLALYENRTDIIAAQETNLNETWRACVTPNDGTYEGATACSNNVFLTNNPPPFTVNVSLNSTFGTNYTTENLTVYYTSYDAYGQPVKNVTNWYLNSTPIMPLNMPFEGGSNSTRTKDYSNYSNNGTVNGATWNSSGGYDGHGAYNFSNKNITIADSPSLDLPSSLSVEAWVRPAILNTTAAKWNSIVTKGFSGDGGGVDHNYLLGHCYNALGGYGFCFTLENATGANCNVAVGATVASVATTGQWYHVVGVFDDANDRLLIYVNGTLLGNASCPYSPNTNARPVLIGDDEHYDGWPWYGTIDDVKIYNRSLSTDQVSALYQNRTNLIVSQETRVNDTWYACITPNDKTQDGAAACSNKLTVIAGGNVAPLTQNVTLNSTLGTNLTTENLTLYYDSYDGNNDAIKNITTWYLNHTTIMLLNMPFEGGSTSTYAKDYSNLTNDGTVGNATYNATGGYDGMGAYHFTQTPTSAISMGAKIIGTPGSFTATAWVYPESDILGGIVSQDNGVGNREWLIGQVPGYAMRVTICNESQTCFENDSSAGTLPQDTWSHVAIAVNDSAKTAYGYINGVRIINVSYLGDMSTSTNAVTKIGWAYADAYDFAGTIDDVQIYNRSLSAEQIRAIYQNRTNLIVSQETRVNDTWYACVTPNDRTLDGSPACSNNLTIREPVSGITSCIQINSSGNYTLSSNLVGAPINVSGVTDVTRACVVISASNVTLNCNGRTITNNGTLDAAGILINGSTTMEYPNVTISNCPGVSLYERGIYLHRTRYDELRNVSANGSVYGVYTHYSSNLTIRNAIAYNNTYGIYLYASPGNNVSNASAYNNTYGIYLYSSSSNRLFNATVSNSTYGVYSYSSSYNSISNSTFRNSTSYGVYLYSSSNRNNVTNSAFYGNYRGIAPTTSSWNTFENNTIYGAGVYGIYAYSGSNYNIMRGNTVANHTSYSIIIYTNCNYNLVTNNSVSAGAGSVYLSGAIGTNVTNNTFSGATTYGVYAYNSNNSRIINNSISGALRGVYVSSPYLTVSNNSISNATQYGIYLYGSYSNVTGNRIYNNTQYGIYQTSSNNHIISGNNITSNGIGGIYLASTASTTTVYGNYVCSNGVDITNASASTTGDEDTCDLWSNWGEKGRPGCTYRCTNLWHTIYGSSGTTVMVLAEANMTVFEYNWSASAYNVYAVNTAKSASLSWSTLLALGRNTSIQPSTSDFTELDTLLGTSAESDRVEIVYSTDGTTPKLTTDRDIFYQNVQYIPIANSTNASSFITGILWDYSSDTDSQFSASDNETVVFWAAINSSSIGAYGTYDYEIRVPDKFATYAPGATTVDIYLELI
ncbi:right-handed parallel beta-helix repeat-containing protein, partial [Candidatus Micrarchaeota archaeon]|nr:right-handed parallel beta-helix repeat-containing protein [Candidatus Micrarchaeota archaeon]